MTSAIDIKELAAVTSQGGAIELKLVSQAFAGEIMGYGSTFGEEDLGGDIVVRGAFAASLARHKANDTVPAMLWQHDPTKPIGTWHEIVEDEKGLKVKGQLNIETQAGQEARALLLGRALKGLSIGFTTKESEFDRATGARKLKAVDLWEISLVTFPMNPKASVIEAKSIGSAVEFERFLKAQGFAKAAARKLALGG